MKLGHIITAGLILGLTTFACSDKKESSDAEKTKEEKAPVVPVVDSKGLKIAFYYSDSLKNGFTYYKNEDARITKKGEAFQNEMMSKQRSLEQKAQNYEKYMREGTATGEQLQALENEIMRMREQLIDEHAAEQGSSVGKRNQRSFDRFG
jgi:hypothetical protein